MFEGLVRQLILGYLGKFIKDIQREQLKITLWNEEVLLENVELILEAFDYLRLPFAFKQGHVGKLSIRIPWKKLGWDPFIIMLEDVYICVSHRDDEEWCLDAVERREFASKKAQLAAAELAKLSRRVCGNRTGKNFVSYITAKILDSIQLSIRNVHILYQDTLNAKEELCFGLKFSSLMIMRQAIGSSGLKVRGGQVNKLIEVQNLELYCDTMEQTYNSSTKDVEDRKNMGREMPENSKNSSILAPMDVSVSLAVNRTGTQLNDVPQYAINVDVDCVATSIDEVQLQSILSLSDYMAICQLREKYGRYRPWWSPIGERLKGWQKAWWHYAQESVLSDARRRLRKTSWKYFGERLYSCRKYVNLYKVKLKCLRQDQVIEETVMRELENIEKEEDIDDILNYRSIAEHELEDFLMKTSSINGKGVGNIDKMAEDDHPPSKPRGWLNWLSYGMLGAGGTDDFNQFSGVVSDDVIEDIYEATKFHPTPALTGDLAANDDVYISSTKISISEIHTTLQSMKLGHTIADFMLKEILAEGSIWDKSAIITTYVNSIQMLNPLSQQVILSAIKVNSEHVLEPRQPSLSIKVDLSPRSCNIGSSVKVTLSPTEVFCDSEFLKNILDFLQVMQELSFQHQRVMLSLNGIDDFNSRLISKIDYVLSSRKKIIWDITLSDIVINLPQKHSNPETYCMIIEASAVSFTSKPEMESLNSLMEDTSDLHGKHADLRCGSVGDDQMGSQLQNLYDHFDICITDAQINLKMPSATIVFLDRFIATATLASCILPNEPILQEFQVHVRVPSLVVHFSTLVYGKIVGLISEFNMVCPPSPSFGVKSNGLVETSIGSWFSIDGSFDEFVLLLDLEENVVDGCILTLYCQKIGIWYDDLSDSAWGWVTLQTCQITASCKENDSQSIVLCSTGKMGSIKHNMCPNLEGQSIDVSDKSSAFDGCLILQFEAQKNIHCFIQKYTIYANDLDVHLYPFIIGKFIGFMDEISVCDASDNVGRKPDVIDENFPQHGSMLDENNFLNGTGSYQPSCIQFDQFPFTGLENLRPLSELENVVDDMKFKFRETLHLREQKRRASKFARMETADRVTELKMHNKDCDFSVKTSSASDFLLVNLNLHSITVHFHDSLYIVGTISVPLAKSLLTISADSMDMVCLTERMVLSSSWWPKTITEFLWGPLSSGISPVLSLHLKKRSTGLSSSHLELNFEVQQVSCMLPPDFLSMIIGYFSLPDWTKSAEKQLADAVTDEHSSTIMYHFKISDSNIITPANSDSSEFLKLNIKQLSINFSPNCHGSSVTSDIPSVCYINAGRFSDRNDCLDFFGCDLSLLLLVKEIANSYQNHILIASLTADLWIRIPYNVMSDEAPYSTCIMSVAKDIQLHVEELRAIPGLKALDYVINQFSMVGGESKHFRSDVQNFLERKKQVIERMELVPSTANATSTELRFCVSSLSIRFHQMKMDLNCAELMAEVEMHFMCSLSLINDKLCGSDISFYSLSLFSLSNSVVLFEFSCPRPGASVLDVVFSVSDSGGNLITISFHCLDIWLHLFDWSAVIDLFNSYSMHMSALISDSSPSELVSEIPSDHEKCVSDESSTQLAPLNTSQSSRLSTLKLEHVGLALHFPALIGQDTYSTFGGFLHKKQQLDDYYGIPTCKQDCFLSVRLQSRKSEVVAYGKTVKLKIGAENLNGALKLVYGADATTWPFFQLSKVNIEANIGELDSNKVQMLILVRGDSMDLSFSNHVMYLSQFRWFEKSEEAASGSNFMKLELDVQLRKFSLLLTDWKSSNGPLLDLLVKNLRFQSTITEDEIEGSVMCDLQVNYYSIDKVLWEPFLEPWNLQLNLHRKLDERALFNGAIITDIILKSKTHINLNLNESIIEVLSMTIEMIKDAWCFVEGTGSPGFYISHITKSPESRRYAPYMLQNLTTVPLVFVVCQRQLRTDDLDVYPSKGVLQPGSSTLIYINESPEELLFRYRPIQSSDKLSDKQLLEAAHRYVTFQLEGTSVPSAPISMDLVGRRFFEVEFSKSSTVSEIYTDENSSRRGQKVEADNDTDTDRGFGIPVVIDVSVQRFTKLIRLYSTVVILNTTSASLELRFDIPFGVSPKVLGPICPGQEFPLPLHLAETGCIRWRPVGDSYLWSESYKISSIISQDVRICFMRSFICYPSHPSNDAFRCCISVNDQSLPSVSRFKRVHSLIDVANRKQSESFHRQPLNMDLPNHRFFYQMVLSSPLVLKNYLTKKISITIEYAGVTRPAFVSEVETSFYCIDCSHDVSVTFQMDGFRPSTLKYPRAESFSKKAKFSGTKFSASETMRFDPEFSSGPLYVTIEKVMDAISGAREILLSVPFLLYNCTGFPLVLSSSDSGMKGHSCIIPSCYNLDSQSILCERKDGLSLIGSEQKFSETDSTSKTKSESPDFIQSGHRKVSPCLFSPDPHSFSGELSVKLSRYLPPTLEILQKDSWSVPFSLVPPTGSTSVLVPQSSMGSGHVLSVSAMAAPFPGRTKVITFQPRYVIANACSKNLCFKQKGTDHPFLLGSGKHSYVQWMDSTRKLLLSVRFDGPGWEWSGCFLPEHLGDTQIKVHNYMTKSVTMLHVEVRSADVSDGGEKIVGSTTGTSGTNLIVLSEDHTGFMPYRIDNHSRERLRIYQQKCESFESVIHPYTSSPYAWDEPCYPHRLTIEVPGERILGSYAIDDSSGHSLVHLPSTSEKPERNLIISVHSEGAIKVLSIIDSNYHVLNDLNTQFKDKGKQAKKYESFTNFKERLSIDIPFLGISLMNSHPEELLFACVKNTKVKFVQSLDQQMFSLQVESLQIDNQLNATLYPVILSFNRGNRGNSLNQMKLKDNAAKFIGGSTSQNSFSSVREPVFTLAVSKWRNTDISLVSFESISLRIADFYLEIEQEIVLRMFEFCKTASSRLQSRVFQNEDSTLNMLFSNSEFIGETSKNALYSAWFDGKHLDGMGTTPLSDDYPGMLLPHMIPIGAPWQEIQIDAQKEKKIYVELFDMEPIRVTLSFSSSPWILRNGVLTSGESLIHRGLMALADVEGAQIRFKRLVLSHQIASWESIQEILVSHYARQFLHEMYKVFGSAGVIGNPVGFARSLGLGLKDFFSLPIWSVIQSPTGLITGMAQGTTSLLSNTVYAITDATSQFSKAAHKGIVAFAFDDQTATVIEGQHRGITSQSKGVINEFLEGLTGVLQSPIKGAEKHGLPGLFSGIARGVTGLVARPAASLLEVTGKTAQSIRNHSRIRRMGYQCHRVRLPRPLSAESPLKPYSWEEAIGIHILSETDMKLGEETLVMCKPLGQGGQYVLTTQRLLLVVSCPSLINLGKPDFEGVPADLNWEIQSIIGLDSIILADNDGQVVHIVGSGSDTLSRHNIQQMKAGNEHPKGAKPWKNVHSPLPLLQTNIEFATPEEAGEFLRVVMCMIERGKEQGWGCARILHQSNIK